MGWLAIVGIFAIYIEGIQCRITFVSVSLYHGHGFHFPKSAD